MTKTDFGILTNTVPLILPGIPFKDRFGLIHAFANDEANPKDLYYNCSVFFQVIHSSEHTVLGEFKTFSLFKCDKRIDEDGFYDSIYLLVRTAIDDFDREFKLLKSTLTFNKVYSPIPFVSHLITPLKQSYMMNDFNAFPNPN